MNDNAYIRRETGVRTVDLSVRESNSKAELYSMAAKDDQTDLNETCTELVGSAISILPSVLERLIALASLRDLDTRECRNRVLAALLSSKFGKAEIDSARRNELVIRLRGGIAELDRAIRREHLAVFEAWLCLNVRQQTEQLECYAARQGIPSRTLSREWLHESACERLIPSGVMPFQRRLFLADMKTVLTTLSIAQA